MKKWFFRKHSADERKGTAGDRKAREIRLLDVDRRFGVGPTEEKILARASAQLRMEIANGFWG